MAQNPNTTGATFLPEQTQNVAEAFSKLGTDDKLALLYYAYKKMGDSITPAAPAAADPELAPQLLGDVYEMSKEEQLAVMRSIVNRDDTTLSRAYGALKENNQLMVWYAWAQAMGTTIVGMPQDYQPGQSINQVLGDLERLDFQEQMSLLREVVSNMGYSDVKPIPTQAETGKTPSL